MSETETFRNLLIDSASQLKKYTEQRRLIEKAIIARIQPPNGKIDRILQLPCSVQDKLDPDSITTRAAMCTAAVGYRAYLYTDEKSKALSFSRIWHNTSLRGLAEKSEEMVGGIVPKVDGIATHVDLKKINSDFEKGIEQGQPESIVVTGLNGVGKTTILNSVVPFLELCGLDVNLTKFPRSDGPLGDVLTETLGGKRKLASNALQYLMVADALDEDVGVPKTLKIYDRFSVFAEALVYGPEELQPSLLAARELFPGPHWVLIVDRHPAASLKKVDERGQNKRIFEQKLERMAEQTVRYAALTAFSNCRLINNDIPHEQGEVLPDWEVESSIRRTIGTIINCGVVERALVRQGVCATKEEGHDRAIDIYIEKMNEWLNPSKNRV